VGDSEPSSSSSSSSSSSETAPQPQKSAPAPLPVPDLLILRVTPDTPGPVGPSEQSREIQGDVAESNIIVGSRARKPTAKASQSYAATFHQAFAVRVSVKPLGEEEWKSATYVFIESMEEGSLYIYGGQGAWQRC
jgi:hypothetical protein